MTTYQPAEPLTDDERRMFAFLIGMWGWLVRMNDTEHDRT